MNINWDEYFMGIAVLSGLRSKDPATKVGPNDPCPCGSGRKYKKCCGMRSS